MRVVGIRDVNHIEVTDILPRCPCQDKECRHQHVVGVGFGQQRVVQIIKGLEELAGKVVIDRLLISTPTIEEDGRFIIYRPFHAVSNENEAMEAYQSDRVEEMEVRMSLKAAQNYCIKNTGKEGILL